jgi:transcriptional regulator with XRE-family HTH domain
MFLQRLDELIQERGITEHRLMRETGIAKSCVWNWRQGCQPTIDKVAKIADYFQVSIDYLVGRENDRGIINVNVNLSTDEVKLLTAYRQLNNQNGS